MINFLGKINWNNYGLKEWYNIANIFKLKILIKPLMMRLHFDICLNKYHARKSMCRIQ